MKILLAKRRALGDTILLTSTVALLKEKFPQARITVLVPAVWAPVLEAHPGIERLWHFEENFFSLVRKIRAEKFDYFFHLHASKRGEWLTRFSGANFAISQIQNKATEKDYSYPKHPNALEWDAFFLSRVLRDPSLEKMAPTPKIYLRAEEKTRAETLQQGFEKLVFLGLGASRSTKRWPAEYFAELAELLFARKGLYPLVVSGPGEEEAAFAAQVIDHLRVRGFKVQGAKTGEAAVLFHSELALRDLAALMSHCVAYVGNDSGPKHLAVALGIPSFTFFGPEDPIEWHPYSQEQHPVFFSPNLSCRKEDSGRWCGIPQCVVEQHRCMRNLRALDVFPIIENRLGK